MLDEGMEVYGGENVELGIRVSRDGSLRWPLATVHPDNGLKITIILMALNVCGGHSHMVSLKYLKDQVSLAAVLMEKILERLEECLVKKKKMFPVRFLYPTLETKKYILFFLMTFQYYDILLNNHL